MAKKRIWLYVGAGVLALGLIGSIFEPSNPDLVEPTYPPTPSSTAEAMQQEPVDAAWVADEPLDQDSAASTQVDAIKEVEVSDEPPRAQDPNRDSTDQTFSAPTEPSPAHGFSLKAVPEYSGSAYTTINGNIPFFLEEDMTPISFETYSELDDLGRCGVAYACVGQDIMPTGERGPIGMIRPSGWETIRYDDLIEDRYLYNRCHLLGYQLTGENANEQNLITGTRYMNIQGMLPFENQVANYVKSTNNHVMFRVTPVFDGDNLLATGVLMEAKSVEDEGEGVSFCIFTYNVQPGILIDYATGASARENSDVPSNTGGENTGLGNELEQNTEPAKAEEPAAETPSPDIGQKNQNANTEASYIGNKNTKKFHFPSCSSVSDMKETNKVYFEGTREQVIDMGYVPCKRCSP